jgi:hypothetical protein
MWDFFRFLHDFSQCLLSNVLSNLPGGERMALLEDLFYFLERAPNRLGEHEEYMEERRKVEGSKYKVSLPCNAIEARRYGKCQRSVERPIGCLNLEG